MEDLGLAKTEVIESLKAKAPQIRALFYTEAWAEWVEWSKLMRSSLQELALRDESQSVREEARQQMLAFEKFERIPFMLLQLVQEGPAASDIPFDTREAQ